MWVACATQRSPSWTTLGTPGAWSIDSNPALGIVRSLSDSCEKKRFGELRRKTFKLDFVQRSHYEVACAGHARSQIVREHWDAPSLLYRLVEGDVTLQRGVELLETSGHVSGDQSLLVRLPQTGPILLAIDAVPTASQMNPDTRVVFPINDEDEAKTRASTRKLVEIAQRESVALIIYGRC
jgi:glyoxylase-like metal-dependent hydrolase (beta-lactamase superfamily II)